MIEPDLSKEDIKLLAEYIELLMEIDAENKARTNDLQLDTSSSSLDDPR